MFFIGSILKKFKEKKQRLSIVRESILTLQIDEKQKQLYLDSLELLNDEQLDNLYIQFTALISILEDNKIKQDYKDSHSTTISTHKTENIEKQKELNSLHLLLENF